MKKRLFVLLLGVVLACTTSACGCKHQWTEANCVAPKTCAVCGETEGEALGHDFAPASCAVPETCTRCGETRAEALEHAFLPATCEDPEVCTHCGKTQGEALGHTYSKWVIAEDAQTMRRQCSICQSEETLPVDYSQILKDALQGHWDLNTIAQGDRSYSVYYLEPDMFGMYLNFREGNHADFYVNQEGYPKDVTWEFAEYQEIQDDSVFFFRIMEDGGISLSAAYVPQRNDGDGAVIIFNGTSQYILTRNTTIAQAVEGTWVDSKNGQLYTTKFSSDHTFTGDFDGQVSGIWCLKPLQTGYGYRSCGIALLYTKDGSDQIVSGEIDLGAEDIPLEQSLEDMRISIYGDFYMYMERMTEEELTTLETAMAEGKQVLLGPWTSTHISTYKNQTSSEVTATDYSITFAEDGTFTATLDKKRSGTWRFDGAYTRNASTEYQYYLTFDGVDKEVHTYLSNDELSFSRYDNGTSTTIYFQQMTEEKIAQREAKRQEAMAQIKGDWTSYLLSEFHYDDNSSLYRSVLNCTLQIREDGTFTAKLDKERTGIWEFREIRTYDSQDYVSKTYCFSLQLEGVKELFEVTVDSTGRLDINLPIKNGSKSLAFRQLTAGDLETLQQLREEFVGSWTAVSAHTYDYNAQTDTPMADCDYTITIREDGTYTAQFSRPVSDIWYLDFGTDGTLYLFLREDTVSCGAWLDEDGILYIWHDVNDQITVQVGMKKNG